MIRVLNYLMDSDSSLQSELNSKQKKISAASASGINRSEHLGLLEAPVDLGDSGTATMLAQRGGRSV